MAEYIERKAALEICAKAYQDRLQMADYCGDTVAWNINAEIKNIPAADVALVKHGRWKLLRKGDWTSVFVCSVCGRRETIAESESYNSQLKMPKKYPYCHCGAKMDGGESNG